MFVLTNGSNKTGDGMGHIYPTTMTAHTNMQADWTKNTENGEKTGILIWDLSAAFDTLDIELLLRKMEVYGFNNLTCNWFTSFLTNRTQKVKIGDSLSQARTLTSGVPHARVANLSLLVTLLPGSVSLGLHLPGRHDT